MTAIGFLGFGEVASRLAPRLLSNGSMVLAYDVLLDRPGGAETLRGRSGNNPVEFRALRDLTGQAQMVLSTVTTDVALDAAKACAPHLSSEHIYIDLNATSPADKRAIGEVIGGSGAAFVEGAILGAVGVTGPDTRILVCGEMAALAAETLAGFGLNIGYYGPEVGKASSFKLLRSVFSKGIEALLLEALIAARRAGVEEEIWREIVETVNERPFEEVGGNWVRTHGTAHRRRYHEMVQVEGLLRDLGLDPVMTGATTAFFERSTRQSLSDRFASAPDEPHEVVAALDDLLKGKADGKPGENT